jgi:predicted nucleotide-binding protein (sugar kinase/HSP70/actin superfamily)
MSFAINALLSESDDEDEDLLNDATQLLEEDEANRNTGMVLQHHPWHKTNDF